MMKKYLALLLALGMVSLAACGEQPEATKAETEENTTAQEEQTAASEESTEETSEEETTAAETEEGLEIREQYDGKAEGYTLRVGVGKTVISPEVGGWLTGYTPPRKSLSKNDDLNAVVFAFEQDGDILLFASFDICNLGTCYDTLRNQMAEATGVPVDRVVIAATHTHSGPSTYTSDSGYTYSDDDYVYNILIPGAVQAACEAIRDLQWAEMAVATIQSEVGINRREETVTGVVLGQDAEGVCDLTMTVLSFRNHTGECIGNIVHYGCHNTASGENTKITRDWCGVMKDRLEALTGGETAFFNGAQGDMGPRLSNYKTTGNTQLMLELGEVAADDVEKCYNSITEWKRSLTMKILTGTVEVPYEPLLTTSELNKKIAALNALDSLNDDQDAQLTGYKAQLTLVRKKQAVDTSALVETTVFSIGDVVVVPTPFECFSQMVLDIREGSSYPYTLVLSNSLGGKLGYFPTEEEYARGGYEVRQCWKKAQRLAEDGTDYFRDGVLKMIERLAWQ